MAAGKPRGASGVDQYTGRAGGAGRHRHERTSFEGKWFLPLSDPAAIKALLEETRTIAMIGASDRPSRPSYGVMARLQQHGYRVIPVNPQIAGEHIHGEYVFHDLAQIGEPIDLVDIFRRSDVAGEAVDAAIASGAKAVWLQLDVIDEAAAARAEAAGLKVVMDRCPAIEIPRLGVAPIR